jgi:hypothetical protein
VVEDVVLSSTGIIVRISGLKDELELEVVCVVFKKGAVRGRLSSVSIAPRWGSVESFTVCHFHHAERDPQSSKLQARGHPRLSGSPS